MPLVRVSPWILAVLLGVPLPAVAATIVDTCGQSYSGVGVLAADLDCTGVIGPAVSIDNPGKLDLAGFEIIGGSIGVVCSRGCTIYSSGTRGTIRDSGDMAIYATGHKVTAENVAITGCGSDGVVTYAFSGDDTVLLIDSEISGCASAGIDSSNAKVIDSTISGNGQGLRIAGALQLLGSQVTGNLGIGAEAGSSSLDLTNLRGAKTFVRGSTVSGNGTGLFVRGAATIKDSAIDDNVGPGVVLDVHESRLRCSDSSFDRNGGDGLYWADAPFDASAKFKRCSISDNRGRGLYLDEVESHLEKLVGIELTVTGNGSDGIFGTVENRPMVFKRSTVSGNGGHGIANPQQIAPSSCDIRLLGGSASIANGTLADCGTLRACADVAACADARLIISVDATCDTSYVIDSGIPGANWGVCALD